jgi:uncharacterized membrane protein YqgA involved in biofilm formation
MTQWALWGTIVNTVAVMLGALLGLGIRAIAGKKKTTENTDLPARRSVADTIQKGLGLCVILIGISGALGVKYMLVTILSVALGALVGELLDLDGLLNRFGAFVERKLGGKQKGSFAEGFVSATLLFCVGAMTVTGALESALMHTHDTYYAKGLIDMVCAVTFATALGAGVVLSAAGVFVVQGTLVLIAVLAGNAIPAVVTGEMIAVGSLLVVAIGTNLLGVTKVKVMNLVPAMFFPIALCPLYELIFI